MLPGRRFQFRRLAALSVLGTRIAVAAPTPADGEAMDPHSYARPREARVTHLHLDLTLDFATRRLQGVATLDLQVKTGIDTLWLDTRDLQIERVSDVRGRPLAWTLSKPDAILGSALKVEVGDSRRIAIEYITSPAAAALQWLDPEQTYGKSLPYLFSQGQTILNRSWIPSQDSPGVRHPWSARVVLPEPLVALMSAESLDPAGIKLPVSQRAFRFRMEQPVPVYLIAIAAGDIRFRSIGPRSGVFAEPGMLARAAAELVDLERMIAAAEGLYGPYRWGRFDVLVMPPSYPIGGMENPRVTFVSPTIIAGDRSLVAVVAHELAHSWSGNLVSNATWEDFWLNEGFTDYAENRLVERLYGARRAAMLADLRWADWQRAISQVGGSMSPRNRLHLDLAGRDPELAINDVAYGKGATFLRVLESTVGRSRWDAYLRGYFDRMAFQSQTTAGFLTDLRQRLFDGDLEARVGFEQWAYESGIPANAIHVQSPELADVDMQTAAFSGGATASDLRTEEWTAPQWMRFLSGLGKLAPARLDELDRRFGLSDSGNSEVRAAWLELAIRNRYDRVLPSLQDFLISNGRNRFVTRLFSALVAEGDWGRPIATRTYALAMPGYHSITRTRVEGILQ